MSPTTRGADSGRRSARVRRPREGATARDERVASALDCFRRVIRVLRVSARHAEAQSALRPAQLFVLGQIAATPGQSLTELAARTLTDRTSVAGMVERLAARGLVERVRGADDRRRVEIRPTAAGAEIVARAPSAPTDDLLDALERLDGATLDRLTDGLGELVRAMGAADEPATMLFEDHRTAPPRRRRRNA